MPISAWRTSQNSGKEATATITLTMSTKSYKTTTPSVFGDFWRLTEDSRGTMKRKRRKREVTTLATRLPRLLVPKRLAMATLPSCKPKPSKSLKSCLPKVWRSLFQSGRKVIPMF